MDNHSDLCYGWEHETTWQFSAIGNAAPEGDRVATCRSDLSEGSLDREVFGEFGRALVSSLSSKRPPGPADQTDSGAATTTDRGPDSDFRTSALRRSAKGGLRHGSVDLAAGGRPDREALRSALWSDRRPPAALAAIGVDLTEAGAPGDRAQRAGHRAVEANGLAGYKKTPGAGARISSFSTKAGFCLSPMCARCGLRSAKRRFCAITTGTTRSRSSLRS
jgi:hypothetical protein